MYIRIEYFFIRIKYMCFDGNCGIISFIDYRLVKQEIYVVILCGGCFLKCCIKQIQNVILILKLGVMFVVVFLMYIKYQIF